MKQTVNIEDEIKFSYLDYAMSVIIGRAIPDVRDGLKPVHRRILFAMYELKNDYNKPYKKSARIVGDVIGKYHPHGDSAVYDALVRMAQEFSMRYPLIDGQGNFGSIDGDPPAAMRYTEVRMARIAHDFLQDIEKDTVDFTPNYDNSLREPTVLPTLVPNLLLNGSSGIAVGMATNIPPHNLVELCNALQALLVNPQLSVKDLMRYVRGPDFPTGGFICGCEGIREAYETGHGSIRIRARLKVEEIPSGRRRRIIITELPYQINKARVLERIAELVREKRITGIQDIRDESDRHGTRIVLSLRPGENPKIIENQLYKFTSLEVNFGVSFLAIVKNRPEILNLKDILLHFLDFRREVIVRRTRYELNEAEKRAHILEGLKIALDHLDQVVHLIRRAKSPQLARQQLVDVFSLSLLQAQAILDMRLQRLTALERNKIIDDYHEILRNVEHLKKILASPRLVDEIINKELEELKDRYGDERRTEIVEMDYKVTMEDLIDEKDMVVTISHAGYVKRTPVEIYRRQRRGGRGRAGMSMRAEDFISTIFTASSRDYLLVFTNQGRLYWLKVYEIPESTPSAAGKAVVNLISMREGERIATILPVRDFVEGTYVVIATRNGIVKKTPLMTYSNPRSNGIRAIVVDEGDEVICARLTDGNRDLFLMSRAGKCIRIKEQEIRPTGRISRGVRGMDLDGSILVGMEVIEEGKSILVVTERGVGKRTPNSAYRVQRRGGKGVINLKVTPKNGEVVGFCQVGSRDEVLLVTDRGKVIRIKVAEIREMGRATQGLRLMNLEDSERVVDVTVVVGSNEEDRRN